MDATSLRDLIRHHGLEKIEGEILAAARPGVALLLGDGPGGPGESRVGGPPDLPRALEWPLTVDGEALAFLLQLNLAGVPALPESPLPARGMLFVFVGLDEPATDVEHRIVLYTGDELLEPRTPPNGPPASETFAGLRPRRLRLASFADIPRWATSDYEALTEDLDDEDRDAYDDLEKSLSRPGGRSAVGQLLGHAAGIGHDPREDAYVVRDVNAAWLYDYGKRAGLDMGLARRWRNLLRLNSSRELNLTIWDAGYLNFLVREDDLAALDFGRVYAAVESS